MKQPKFKSTHVKLVARAKYKVVRARNRTLLAKAASTRAAAAPAGGIPVLTPEASAAVLADIEGIQTKLPFLIALSSEDAAKLYHMGENSVSFAQNALQHSGAHPEIMAGTFSHADFAARMALFAAFQPIINAVAELSELINGTVDFYGAAAMQDGLEVYRALQQAIKKNPELQPLVDQLGERFKKTRMAKNKAVSSAPGRKEA